VWASKDPERAKTLADLFAVVQNIQRERQGANFKRYAALYDMARAKQLKAAGDLKAAIHLFSTVYDDFTALGFVWRAGEALIELGKLTHDTETVKHGRDQVAQAYPNSLIVKNADFYLLMAKFTPTEKRVITALVSSQCASSDDVASNLSMAIGTLNKHIAHIAEKVGASGRKGITALMESANLPSFEY
jgi:DNA-binding CsgD family transcriptional regulator